MSDKDFVDGVSTAEPAAVPPNPSVKDVPKKPTMLKAGILLTLGVPYIFYVIWCVFLLSSLPTQGAPQALISAGVISTIAAGLLLLGVGALAFFRVSASKAGPNAKLLALIKLGAFVLPGLILSVITPIIIAGEPSFSIDIVSPSSSTQFVAPLSIQFSVQTAVDALSEYEFKPIQYSWDINGDKKVDQQTLGPNLTASFDKEGIYTVAVSMKSSDGTIKTASKRFIISQSVFSVTPSPAIVDRPTVFSLAHLFSKPEEVLSVAWDFDGDGTFDEENGGIEASYTYLSVATYSARAVVNLANKTQAQYQRDVEVTVPPELPFPVSIGTQPQNLIGSAPFSALFTIETEEPVYSVEWDFGDGLTSEGTRATHTFARNGTFAVVAKVRSQSGVVANLGTVVKVVQKLDIGDLRFEGSPAVNGFKISGEVPLTLDLTPVTAKPFVQFSWEAPDATEVGSTDNRLQAIFRRAGTYTVTLIGQDLENHVMRQPITVEVKPPSSFISFQMKPESGLAPLSVTFDASESSIPGEDITGFIWNFGDSSPQETGGAVTQHVYNRAGTYQVNLTARTTSGIQQSTTRTLVVREPNLQARVFASRYQGAAPLIVEFDGSASVGTIAKYVWDFGDGSQTDGQKVTHPFIDPGIYDVKLTVEDTTGATATTTVTITVQ